MSRRRTWLVNELRTQIGWALRYAQDPGEDEVLQAVYLDLLRAYGRVESLRVEGQEQARKVA